MIKKLAIFTFLSLCFATSVSATPSVSVTTQLLESSHQVIFTFIQNDLPSMEGCFYNLLASSSKRNLTRKNISGRSIATFFKPLPTVQIIAGPLRELSSRYGQSSRARRKATVYFRTLLTCYNGEITRAETFSIDFKTSPTGELASVNRLIQEMKHNMAYYDG